MRWFWRADPLTVLLDGLLEGSLAGVAYNALAVAATAIPGAPYVAPLPLPVFWLAAAAGLAVARLPNRKLRAFVSVPVVAVGLGALGWAAYPDVVDALLRGDPGAALATHPAGWMLAVAVLRGAVHSNAARESDVSTTAMAVSFPVLGACLFIQSASGHGFAALALLAGGVCIVAGMLSLGLARMRELESMVIVDRPGTRAWRQIAGGIVVLALAGVLVALVVGTVAQDPLFRLGRWVGDGGQQLAVALWGAVSDLVGALARLFNFGPPHATPRPARPQILPTPIVPPRGTPVDFGQVQPALDLVLRVALLAAAVVGFLLLQAYARRWRPRGRHLQRRQQIRQERTSTGGSARLALRGLIRHPGLPFRRGRPSTAPEAYLAALAELSERDDLRRRPDETPRQHAGRVRVAGTGLDARPLGLLAADYQLAVYGRVPITALETHRAVGRWQTLRRLVKRLPQEAEPDGAGSR